MHSIYGPLTPTIMLKGLNHAKYAEQLCCRMCTVTISILYKFVVTSNGISICAIVPTKANPRWHWHDYFARLHTKMYSLDMFRLFRLIMQRIIVEQDGKQIFLHSAHALGLLPSSSRGVAIRIGSIKKDAKQPTMVINNEDYFFFSKSIYYFSLQRCF